MPHRAILDVPFIPDREYVDFLRRRREHLGVLHFSLYNPLARDARFRMRSFEPKELSELLSELPGPKKLALLNARQHDPGVYLDTQGNMKLLDVLAELHSDGNLHGIVFADTFFLEALSATGHPVVEKLEAIPGVNMRIDRPERLLATYEAITRTRFLPPSRFVADRSMNRDRQALEDLRDQAQTMFPGIKMILLANEGCLPHCPYRDAHEALIAAANSKGSDSSYQIIHDLGCLPRFASQPDLMLRSPFIRPEDVSWYLNFADGIKVCGRSRETTTFIRRAVDAYVNQSYDGNLLEILDSLHELSTVFDLDNCAIPQDFVQQRATCKRRCDECANCATLAAKVIRRTAPELAPR